MSPQRTIGVAPAAPLPQHNRRSFHVSHIDPFHRRHRRDRRRGLDVCARCPGAIRAAETGRAGPDDVLDVPPRSRHDVVPAERRPREGHPDLARGAQGGIHLRRIGWPRRPDRQGPEDRQVGRPGVLCARHRQRRLPGRYPGLGDDHAGDDRQGHELAAVAVVQDGSRRERRRGSGGRRRQVQPRRGPDRVQPCEGRLRRPQRRRHRRQHLRRLERGVLRQEGGVARHPGPGERAQQGRRRLLAEITKATGGK